MGIHNEAGTYKLEMTTASELVGRMLTQITDTTDKDKSFVPFKGDGSDEVVLLVNDLGAISELEMGGLTNEGTFIALSCRGGLLRTTISCQVASVKEDQSSSSPCWHLHDISQHAWFLPYSSSPPSCFRKSTLLRR